MSLAGKIYSIVALLVAIAVTIAGVGIYGIKNMNTNTDQLARIANRAVALNRMDRVSLARAEGAARISSPPPPSESRMSWKPCFCLPKKTWPRK